MEAYEKAIQKHPRKKFAFLRVGARATHFAGAVQVWKYTGISRGADPFIQIYFEQSAEPMEVLLDTGLSGELMLQRERIRERVLKEAAPL